MRGLKIEIPHFLCRQLRVFAFFDHVFEEICVCEVVGLSDNEWVLFLVAILVHEVMHAVLEYEISHDVNLQYDNVSEFVEEWIL